MIIEMLANVNLSNDLNLLSNGGRVIVSIPFFFNHFEVIPLFNTVLQQYLTIVMLLFIIGCWQ